MDIWGQNENDITPKVSLKDLINMTYLEAINILMEKQNLDMEYLYIIANCPIEMFSPETCKNAITLFKKKFAVKTVGEMINEITYPTMDRYAIERKIIEMNFIDKNILRKYQNTANIQLGQNIFQNININRNKFNDCRIIESKNITSRIL